MRPRKTVYLIDHRPVEFSVMSMRLDMWGFRVLPDGHRLGPNKESDAPVLDLVLCFVPREQGKRWADYAQWVARLNDARVMLVGDPQDMEGHTAHAAFDASASPAEIRESLRMHAVRKRGPKNHRRRVQLAVAVAANHHKPDRHSREVRCVACWDGDCPLRASGGCPFPCSLDLDQKRRLMR